MDVVSAMERGHGDAEVRCIRMLCEEALTAIVPVSQLG